MELTKQQLANLLTEAAELGALKALAAAGTIKPYLNKSEAFRLYGRANVSRWILEGLLTPRKDGNDSAAWRLDRVELEAVAKASNRHTYLSVEERKPIVNK